MGIQSTLKVNLDAEFFKIAVDELVINQNSFYMGVVLCVANNLFAILNGEFILFEVDQFEVEIATQKESVNLGTSNFICF